MTVEQILEQIDKDVDKPFVTAKFGNHWKEHAKQNYDIDTIIGIAWRRGRRAILLENALRKLSASTQPTSEALKGKAIGCVCKTEEERWSCRHICEAKPKIVRS